MIVSKSDYKTGMECPKHLWLIKHHPELRQIQPMDRLQLEGIAVGNIAANLFDGVTAIPYSKDQSIMIDHTNKALANGDKVIAEASFRAGDLYCRVDFLEVFDDDVVINEVKAVNGIRKIRKKGGIEYEAELLPEYLYDCAFQYYALTEAGFTVKQVNCIHLNKEYKRNGDLDYSQLFTIDDVTEEVIAYINNPDNSLLDDIHFLQNYAGQDEEPEDSICSDCRDCEMAEHCWADIPSPNVWDLNGTYNRKRDKWYKDGLVSFEDLLAADVLPEKGRMQVEAELFDKQFVDPEKIKEFMEDIYFPLYFLDFETYQNAIPEYDGQWPYEQVPFQYSLHILKEPGAELEHREFLADENRDPRRDIAERLVQDIPVGVCVTAYNISFERARLRELAEMFPDLSEHLLDIAEHLMDFEVPFKKYYYMIKDMHGMSTIKKVLPALYPGDESLNYHNLPGVQNGGEAMDMFIKLRTMDPEERARQREYMLMYCGLDTYAMVKVYEALLSAAGL